MLRKQSDAPTSDSDMKVIRLPTRTNLVNLIIEDDPCFSVLGNTYHNKFDDASKKMVGKSDEGGMTGVIERDSERGEGD